MGAGRIERLTMPKWGLSMVQGTIVQWLAAEGATVQPGDELVEVETDKILSVVESPASGVLRRQVAAVGAEIPVAGLLGVIADADVPADEIDRIIAEAASQPVVEEASQSAGPEPQTVDAAGHTLRFLQRGEGQTPAILIHGFGGDLNNWLFNHEALAARRRVYALDLPGHGGSSKRVADGTPEAMADALIGFMDALAIPRAHLVGHSFGGAVALAAALNHPDRVRSLTLISSAGLGTEVNGGYIDGFIAAARRNQLKPVLESLFADPRLMTRQMVEDILKYKRIDGAQQALKTIAAASFPDGRQAHVYRDRLGAIAAPILVLWGEKDQIIPACHARGLPDRVEVQVFEDRGHMAPMEAAGPVNRAIDQFLRDAE